MAKKNTKGRTQAKDLPKKERKLSARDMKKVKGGLTNLKPSHDFLNMDPTKGGSDVKIK